MIVFAISMVLGSLYTGGDQRIYTAVYNEIGSMGLIEAYAFYQFWLTSIEIIHFLFVWLLSGYIGKVFLFSALNTFFAGLIIRLFDSLKVNFLVTAFFLLTNFYLYVLFFAAERLKLGFILLLLSLVIRASKKLKITLVFMSLTAHLQMLLVVAPKVFETALSTLVRLLKVQRFKPIYLLILVPFLLTPLILDYLIQKAQAYSITQQSIFDYMRISIFLLLSLWYAPKGYSARRIFIIFFPLFICVFFVGGDRINMIGYLYFLMFALEHNNGLNMGILITSMYFFVKTIIFVNNIIQSSTGFV